MMLGEVRAFLFVAGAVAGRQIRKFFGSVAFLIPAAFPIFFFLAFAGGLSRVGEVPGFEFAAGYTAFQFVWALLQAVAMGGAFTGFSIAGDFESGFARRFMLAAPRRSGIILGYVLASLVRTTFTGSLVFIVGIATGMQILGTRIDMFGLIGLAVTVNVAATLFGAGMAMLFRTQQAGPLIQTPIFMLLFLSPVYVPFGLLEGWIRSIAALNPITFILEAGRSLIAGDPAGIGPAFALGAALIAVFAFWAMFALRRAERAG
ncbi:MAG: ABC transporter permease [Rubrobacter sp.]